MGKQLPTTKRNLSKLSKKNKGETMNTEQFADTIIHADISKERTILIGKCKAGDFRK